jgi:2-polyprenyl-6-methoxyphenol hydroxylase-like FAD-dependent oxidoreductase
MQSTTDIAILGGGLAGLTLSLQLRQQHPDIGITVIERRHHPVPESAHKVGESTVEIGAHYLAEVIGLKDHLDQDHLRKYGLRVFFDAGKHDDLSCAGELGASHLLTLRSYQIDRGVLENHLAERAQSENIALIGGASVTDVVLGDDDGPHQVSFRCEQQEQVLSARWVVDAMSRGSVIKRRLGLAEENGHYCSSVWFRIADRIDISQWSVDADWQQRCNQLPRWQSTNHLMGPGYWVWLIPLASGSTSIGIVFDNQLHDFDQLKTWDGTLDWLAQHQPRCYRAIDESDGKLQDFLYLRNFSHGCKQVYSGQRWALTGEAGVFLDPFYSPGSDFIAISNTYISDLIRRDLAGEPIARQARLYERNFLSFYESSLDLYRDQYPLFGHARAMSAKTIWDYAYYWSVLALFFFAERLTDIPFLIRHATMLDQLRRLNVEIQTMFRHWASEEGQIETAGLFVNQSALPLLVRLNRELTEVAAEDDEQLDRRMRTNGVMLRQLAGELRTMAPDGAAACVSLHDQTPASPQPLLAGLPESFTQTEKISEPV